MISSKDIISEISFSTSRSSGPGGQNVNKVESKVYLKFDIRNSNILTEHQKGLLMTKLSNRVNKSGILILSSQTGRNQLANKEIVLTRLDILLKNAFTIKKKRKESKPSKAAIEKRLKEKKANKEKKERRKGI